MVQVQGVQSPNNINAINQRALDGGGSAGGQYSVVRGDCLWAIAKQHGVSLSALIAANPQIKNPNLIYPGDQIKLPSGASAGGSTGTPGGTTGPGGTYTGPTGGAQRSVDVAKTYLGQWASQLKANTRDQLPMEAWVGSNVCCANFVSAVLQQSGQIPPNVHENSVAGLSAKLKELGWTVVPAGSPPQAGDVAIMKNSNISHTVLVTSPTQTIGSNNRGAAGQQVSMGSTSYVTQNGGYFLRPPAGQGGGTQGAGGSSPARGVGDPGTHEGRLQAAIQFFESKGWSKAQAIGIVANLEGESGMRPGQAQYGGGPGFGLAQWEGPRQAAFREWAGKDIRQSTFQEQLNFIQHELTTSERGAGNRLRGATSAAEAAAIVCRYYERPADIVGDSRERAVIANTLARNY